MSAPREHEPERGAPSAEQPAQAAESDPLPVEATTDAALNASTFRSRSVSIGACNGGSLRRGVHLRSSSTIVVRESNPVRYGTRELVDMLKRSSQAVTARFPGSKLFVGDLSERRGGRVHPHRSHRSGRDADVGFYVMSERSAPASVHQFLHMRRNGTAVDRRGRSYRFDVARNWALVESMLRDPVARVQYIFVASWLSRRLLSHARSSGAQPELIARADTVMRQPAGSPHDSHFHVRIYCPVDDRHRCSDDPPYHPWFEGTPSRPRR
ncbi:MAG: penicillin-insensitive murein endopeptidase [Myxococcota bacterium]